MPRCSVPRLQARLPQALRDLPWIGAQAQDMLQQLSADPTALRGQFVVWMEQSSVEVSRLIGGVGRNVAKLFFAVFSMFFLLRDGPRLMREARAYSRRNPRPARA